MVNILHRVGDTGLVSVNVVVDMLFPAVCIRGLGLGVERGECADVAQPVSVEVIEVHRAVGALSLRINRIYIIFIYTLFFI
jgi:hypothetical protein